MFIEKPLNTAAKAQRKKICGIATNDANYLIRPRINGKQVICPYFKVWNDMIHRCYDIRIQNLNPSYKNSTVDKQWLYFSKFKEWMQTQNWQNKCLDKDLFYIKGNKHYSARSCCFITYSLNNTIKKNIAKKSNLPKGVSQSKYEKGYSASIRVKGNKTYLGYFTTKHEASIAYNKALVRVLINIANEESDVRIYFGILNFANKIRNKENKYGH